MKKIYLSILLSSALISVLKGQYISEVLEYKPAPGQFINASPWGIASSATSLVGSLSGSMSLGAFGGYVVFKFDDAVENDKDNPYGIDFVIYGNPLENLSTPELNNNVTWSEPGIVSVMKDENNNGEPDDTWYELAGSDYFFTSTIKDYEVTYYNPGGDEAADVQWLDNQGDSGYVYANSFHSQSYYPQSENFPDIDEAAYSLSGTRIKDFVDRTNPSYITAAGRPWGYVDNNLRNTYDGLPDNPYTDNVEEGSGGDAFDISWAVDENGDYVDLDEIDFIRVHNGTLADAGWLGEVSTEITGAFDVAPDASVTGWDSVFLALNNIPIEVSVGETHLLEATFFINGRKIDTDKIVWTGSPDSKVNINDENILTTVDTGSVTLTASCEYNGVTYTESMITEIIAPASVEITFDHSEIRVGEKYLIEAAVLDQNGSELSGLEFVWETSNDNIAIKEYNDSAYVAGLQTGTSRIYVYPGGYPDILDSIDVTILEAADSLNIYLTIKTTEATFIPRTKTAVSNYELSPFITSPYHDYGLSDITNVTAAHAVASVFENVSFESDLRFKDTEDDGLYIYRLPVISGSQSTYYYGYGNIDNTSGNNSCWLVKVGDDTYFINLEDVTLFEEDEVVVYYIDDITDSWDFYSLSYSATFITPGSEVNLTLSRESFYLYSETTVMSTGSVNVGGEIVYIDGEARIQNGDTLKTDDEGKAELIINEPGNYTVQLATEEFELEVGYETSVYESVLAELSVYPNMADKFVTVATVSVYDKVRLNVYSIDGELIEYQEFDVWPGSYNLDVSGWNEGIYIIHYATALDMISKKIIVKH